MLVLNAMVISAVAVTSYLLGVVSISALWALNYFYKAPLRGVSDTGDCNHR